MNSVKGSRILRYNLGAKYVLSIKEDSGFSKWSICDKKGRVIKIVTKYPKLKKLLIIKSDAWIATKENGCSIILYRLDFRDAVVGLLLLFHEIGHLTSWDRFSRHEKIQDERYAWAFSFREVRRLERELEVKLLTFERFNNFIKKVHRWIDNQKPEK